MLTGYLLTSFFVHGDPTQTAIHRLLGFNHSCNVIDHEPSRTVSAMLWPFWEIPFFLYVVFNFLRVNDAYRKDQVPRYIFAVATVFLPLQVLLTVWVRLVFVWDPEINFLNHYLPYIGLQLLLALTAFQNVLYLNAVRELPINSRLLAIVYLIVLFGTTILYSVFGLSIALGHPILDSVNNLTHRVILQSLARLYFVLEIPIPLLLSILGLKRSRSYVISFS